MKQDKNSDRHTSDKLSESSVLEHLEAMWDKQIMKGDDDLLQERDRIRHEKKTFNNQHKRPKRKNRI